MPRQAGGTVYKDGKVFDASGKEIKETSETGWEDPEARRFS